ncbi:MAG: putative zinc-binding protein [Bacteroidales bacterium]
MDIQLKMDVLKVGLLSCSGEECLGGTVSRLATRKVLEELKMIDTVTLCLPLYLAGGAEERNFARDFPTISVDGCDKLCAKRSTEKYSGKVSGSIDVSKIIGNEKALNKNIIRIKDLKDEHFEMIEKVVGEILGAISKIDPGTYSGKAFRGCGCGD